MKIKVSKEEAKENAKKDVMCSKCGDYADVIIPHEIKLCKNCYIELGIGILEGDLE